VRIELPEPCLVVLIGTTGSGKTTFAREHFRPTEVLSSDSFRGMVSDDENDQGATADAFDALHFVLGKRLGARRLTVVDATNVLSRARAQLEALAARFGMPRVAIVLLTPMHVCEERNRLRPDRQDLRAVLLRQYGALRRTLDEIDAEGFEHVWRVEPDQVDSVEVVRKGSRRPHRTRGRSRTRGPGSGALDLQEG